MLRDHRAPVVTHVIWYRVGSADDTLGKSGLAHFFEHLMFKATATATTPAGEYKKIAARNGGQINARTSYDYTNYFFRLTRAQSIIAASAVFRRYNQQDLADWYDVSLAAGVPLDSIAAWDARVAAVTRDEVRTVVSRYLVVPHHVDAKLLPAGQ